MWAKDNRDASHGNIGNSVMRSGLRVLDDGQLQKRGFIILGPLDGIILGRNTEFGINLTREFQFRDTNHLY